jgi:hypothetical protein
MNHAMAANILNFGSFVVVLTLLIWRFTKHLSYWRTVFETWIGLFIWAMFDCLVFPWVFLWLGYKDAFFIFPEVPGVFAVAVLGWVFGLELVAVIFLVRHAWKFTKRTIHRFTKSG